MEHQKSKGNLVVISGFSGAGKGTVVRELTASYGYKLSVSATTRSPRQGEENGVHYFFLTKDEFLEMIDRNGLIEYARYVDHYYGTPREFVEKELELGHTVLLEIEVQGALSIRDQYPEAILIFITAPSAESLRQRLTGRGTESPEVTAKRMERAREEAESIDAYDYFVCNEDGKVSECARTIHAIIQAEECRRDRRTEWIEEIRCGLDKLQL